MQITHASDPYSVLCVVRRPSDMFFQEASSPPIDIDPWSADDLRHQDAATLAPPPVPDADSAAAAAAAAALSLIRDQISPCLSSAGFDRLHDHRRRGKLRKRNTEEQLVLNSSRLGRHESSRSGAAIMMMELTTDEGGSLSQETRRRQEAPCDGSSKGKEGGDHGEDDTASAPTTNLRPCKRVNTCSSIAGDGNSSRSSRHEEQEEGAELAGSGRRPINEASAIISQSGGEDMSYSSSRSRSSWSFRVMASLRANSSPSALASTDVIAALDFDETGSFFATGGISRKIRVCSFGKLVEEEVEWMLHDEAAMATICTPAKLSSLRWRPLHGGIVGCGDYDGVVTEWDVEQGVCVSERDEHGGRRIWSVDYSPNLCASASADSTVKLWSPTSDRSVGVIRPPGESATAQVCCAQFSPAAEEASMLLAIACADSNIFVYDLRRTERCVLALRGHERAASYVRFVGGGEELVSASIDSTLRHWAVTEEEEGGGGGRGVVGVYRGHHNVKNFVGLSVERREGLIACGSETNEVYVYEKGGWEGQVWKGKVGGGGRMEEEEAGGGGDVFVGAVCWRPGGGTLVAANSEGTVDLISASRRRTSGGGAAS